MNKPNQNKSSLVRHVSLLSQNTTIYVVMFLSLHFFFITIHTLFNLQNPKLFFSFHHKSFQQKWNILLITMNQLTSLRVFDFIQPMKNSYPTTFIPKFPISISLLEQSEKSIWTKSSHGNFHVSIFFWIFIFDHPLFLLCFL